jgi:hypothetical protein
VAAALSFLEANGLNTRGFNDARLYKCMIGIAEKRMTKRDLAQLLREEGEQSFG